MLKTCGDEVHVGRGDTVKTVRCNREHGHPVVGIDGNPRQYDFHEGDGWVWDNRCAWKKGEEPQRR